MTPARRSMNSKSRLGTEQPRLNQLLSLLLSEQSCKGGADAFLSVSDSKRWSALLTLWPTSCTLVSLGSRVVPADYLSLGRLLAFISFLFLSIFPGVTSALQN